jgi:NADH-quinone oxidoreductase subunit N
MLNFSLISSEIFLLAMTCIVLLADLFIPQRKHMITYALTQITLIGAIVITVCLYCVPNTVAFNGLYIHDTLGSVLKISIYVVSIFVFIYSRDFFRENDMAGGEPYLLGLFSILGMSILVSAYNFMTLYLGLELMSLPIYALVAFRRSSQVSTEAGMKYFVLGALASGILLYGMSMIYGATGSLQIDQISTAIGALNQPHALILIFGLVFVVAGLAFKLGVVPFHMWVPDVYTGAPNVATLFIAVAPKIAAFGMIIRIIVEGTGSLQIQWQELFILMAILSMLLGNIVAIAQTNIKRMFAYSTIAHGGYLLLGFAAGGATGYSAALFYTIAYAVMSLGGFGLITLLSQKGASIESVDDLRGLHSRNPWLAFMMLLLLFSMAGIPPTVGFFAKLGLLQALISADLTWLAILAMIFACIGVFYYLRVVKVMYFDSALDNKSFVLSWDAKLAISLNGLVILYFGLFPSALIMLCRGVFGLV